MTARMYRFGPGALAVILAHVLSVDGVLGAQSVEPVNAWQTEGRIELGTQGCSIRDSAFVVDEKTFGPPEGWAGPKKGKCFLLVQLSINAKTDKQWVEALQTVSLKDAKGEAYRRVLWLLNGAYRPSLFLSMAEGQGVSSCLSTTLAFCPSTPLPQGLELVADGKRIAIISELLTKTSRSGAPIPCFSLDQEGATAYCLASGVALRAKPTLGEPASNAVQLAFGDSVTTSGETKGDWVKVAFASKKTEGWVHRAALTLDKALCAGAKKIGAIPKTLVYISHIKEPSTFQCTILTGGLRLGTERGLADHGLCVVIGNDRLSSVRAGVSMKGFGIQQTLAFPPSWSPYFYSSGTRTFQPLGDLVRSGKQLVRGKELPSESPALAVQGKAAAAWPALTSALKGGNPVRIVNPNAFKVKVAIRTGTKGADFDVASNGSHTVYAPDGRYDIYFQYANDPESLYQGDSFTLADQGVEIRLVTVRNGNYNIRKIR